MLGEQPGKILVGNTIKTHDPELDRMNFISYSSKTIDRVKKYLQDTANKGNIKRLIENGWVIDLYSRRLDARTDRIDKGQDPAFIEDTLNSLISLSRSASS